MVYFFPPLKPPSPQISVAKVLIVCYCHDKRLRNFLVSGTTVLHNIWRRSLFRLFYSKWPSFFYFSEMFTLQSKF